MIYDYHQLYMQGFPLNFLFTQFAYVFIPAPGKQSMCHEWETCQKPMQNSKELPHFMAKYKQESGKINRNKKSKLIIIDVTKEWVVNLWHQNDINMAQTYYFILNAGFSIQFTEANQLNDINQYIFYVEIEYMMFSYTMVCDKCCVLILENCISQLKIICCLHPW